MKIVFFSDIHGNKYSYESFLNNIEVKGADLLVFCGDVFGYYYYQSEILDSFRQMKNLICIKGNHDKYFLEIIDGQIDEATLVNRYGSTYHNISQRISRENKEFVLSWKTEFELDIDDIRIAAFHGTPEDQVNGRLYPDTEIMNWGEYLKYDFVVLGHTHHKLLKQKEGTFIVNPGSLGQQRDGRGCSFIVLETLLRTVTFHVIDYDVEALSNDVDLMDSGNESLKNVLKRKR